MATIRRVIPQDLRSPGKILKAFRPPPWHQTVQLILAVRTSEPAFYRQLQKEFSRNLHLEREKNTVEPYAPSVSLLALFIHLPSSHMKDYVDWMNRISRTTSKFSVVCHPYLYPAPKRPMNSSFPACIAYDIKDTQSPIYGLHKSFLNNFRSKNLYIKELIIDDFQFRPTKPGLWFSTHEEASNAFDSISRAYPEGIPFGSAIGLTLLSSPSPFGSSHPWLKTKPFKTIHQIDFETPQSHSSV